MDKKEAIYEMRRMWGDEAAYRRNPQAATGEEREALRETLPALREAEMRAIAARDAKREELLKDPEYARLHQAAKEAVEKRQEIAGKIHTRRITIGKLEGGFFLVVGEGDNWAEAVRQAKEKGK